MHEIILGYQGEMSLKGLNRNQFESAMMKILRYRLKTVGKFKVYCTQSTFYMEPEEEDVDMDLAFDRVSKVFGLASLSRAVVCDKDFDTICQTAEEYLGASLHGIRTFKVEARRSDKSYPMTSPELMRELGAYLLGKHNYLKVDVHNPQFKVIVEIRDYGAYIHGPKVPGEGGLPVGTSGRALNMLSGGIDSPVAAYRMAKRGLALDHIHFASPPYTSERAKLKVKALAQLTSIYTGSSNLFVVPYTKPQEYIRDNAPDVLFTVLMRRSMMRIANVIAKRQGCEALVTGESLAQVASQTVKALQCTDAAQDLPILRPLIGMDKTEIVETARHINTFETSILPYEDCCTIFTPPHPKIRPELEEILEAEAAMPGLAALEAEAAENAGYQNARPAHLVNVYTDRVRRLGVLAAGHQAQSELGFVQDNIGRNEYDKRNEHHPVELKAADIDEEGLLLRDVLHGGRNVVGVFGDVYRLYDDRCRRKAEHVERRADDRLIGFEVYTRDRKQSREHKAGYSCGKDREDDDDRRRIPDHVFHSKRAAESAHDHYALKAEVYYARVLGKAAAESDEDKHGSIKNSVLDK